ncbi:dTDP-4-dehydrorhamnose reductase [Tunturibacter empetritectus]|uniref:dTDP-4-dehydrorhamnose reductase n=1 Tax=Tunturiibacter lichenicola TaxID=2051959 RepID=A0A7W8J6I8_9BACT|nr:dTDP-4-dehydrorhamnose reductase [Edaphobacter lichenicola]MBB5342209.1 dTDP-4-dehydrorhamnose reductase [Edaphobacter lichenicola]
MVSGRLPSGERILLTGAKGQVGGELLKTLEPLGVVIAPERARMDLADATSVRDTIRAVRPRWIVNAGAYTAVDRAESEPGLVYAINAEAVKVIGEEARVLGAGVIHFSTDYVFDGSGEEPYVETDAVGPMSVYGASKLAGERALAESGAGHMIFRTSWVYGARGKNFLLTILKLAREREALRIVADQHGGPTWARDLARMTAHVIERCEATAQTRGWKAALQDKSGVYHATGGGETTWLEFAAEAVQLQHEKEPGVRFAKIEAISTDQYPTPARRPSNSRLNCTKLKERFEWTMMDWRDSLREVLSEL